MLYEQLKTASWNTILLFTFIISALTALSECDDDIEYQDHFLTLLLTDVFYVLVSYYNIRTLEVHT